MLRHKPRCSDPPPTDGFYRKVVVEFQDDSVKTFVARFDVAAQWWLCQDGSLVWPTNWDSEPIPEQ